HGRSYAVAAVAATRDPVPAARRAAAVSARLPRRAARASGRAVGGRYLPAASRPLRGSLVAVGDGVDAAASEPPTSVVRTTAGARVRTPCVIRGRTRRSKVAACAARSTLRRRASGGP